MIKYREKYLKNNGGFCPYCYSEDIEGDDMEFGEGYMDFRMGCTTCLGKWWDHYILDDVIEAVDENGKKY